MSHYALEVVTLEIKSTAAQFPLPNPDVADRLVDLLVPVDYHIASGDGAA